MSKLLPESENKVLVAYSHEELAARYENWQWESVLRQIHYQNLMLFKATEAFSDFIGGNAPMPTTPLSSLLRPARNAETNYSDLLLWQLLNLMLKTPYEEIPALGIACEASRSTTTLLDALDELNPTNYLFEARSAIERIFNLLNKKSDAPANAKSYCDELNELFPTFTRNCVQNAKELTYFEANMRQAARQKSFMQKTRKTPRAAHFNDTQRKMATSIWLEAQQNPALQSICNGTRVSHAAAFTYYQRPLKFADINTPEDFVRCLESERNRHNYRYKMGLGH